MCYHAKFGSSASKDVRINRSKPKNGGAQGLCPIVVETRPHECYTAEFGRSMSNGTSVIKEICQKC